MKSREGKTNSPDKPAKRMIKPKKYRGSSVLVSTRFPKDLVADLNTAASAYGKTRRDLIEEVLSDWLEANEQRIGELSALHKPNKREK